MTTETAAKCAAPAVPSAPVAAIPVMGPPPDFRAWEAGDRQIGAYWDGFAASLAECRPMYATDADVLALVDAWVSEAREHVYEHARPATRWSPAPAAAGLEPLPVPSLMLSAPPGSEQREPRPRWFRRKPPAEEAVPEREMDDTDIRKLPAIGRHAVRPGAADEQEAPTLLPGEVVPVITDADEPGLAQIERTSKEALLRAGATESDLELLSRPGDGRQPEAVPPHETSEMTAVTDPGYDTGNGDDR